MVGLLLIPFALLLLMGMPIAFCLLFGILIFMHVWGGIPLSIIPKHIFNGMDSFPQLAIPFFVLAGQLMNKTGITKSLVDFSNIIIGRVWGGLAQVNILASILFAGITGSGVADTSALGSILIPAMEKEGFKRDYSAAVTAASSVIGPIIPPSILMVIYGNLMGMSIGELFAAGFIPGLLIGLGLMILSYYYAKKYNHPRRTEKVTFKEFKLVFKDAVFAIIMPLIIIGGILFGIFTPTEAAAVAVGYSLVVGFFIFRTLKLRDLPECLIETAKTTSFIMLIIGCATAFGWGMSVVHMPEMIANFFLSITTNKYLILLLINVLLLFMGMIMETGANVIILAPILAPLALKLGVDPLHFALIMIVNLNIGLATPPLGVCLFAASSISNLSIEKISKAIFPFLLVEVFVLFLLTYIPALTLVVPRLLGFGG